MDRQIDKQRKCIMRPSSKIAACMYVCMYVYFGQGSSLLWTYTLRPFYSRPIALTKEGRSLVNDVEGNIARKGTLPSQCCCPADGKDLWLEAAAAGRECWVSLLPHLARSAATWQSTINIVSPSKQNHSEFHWFTELKFYVSLNTK